VTINRSPELIHLPFAERQEFASPYPLGFAVTKDQVTGDASGGIVQWLIAGKGGFFYRVESVTAKKESAAADKFELLTSSRWMSDRSGLGATSFDITWMLELFASATFAESSATLRIADLQQLRRMPIGIESHVALQTLFRFIVNNENTTEFTVRLVLSYWSTQSLQLPGFMASFMEAPPAPLP